jgi:hypothetical protein
MIEPRGIPAIINLDGAKLVVVCNDRPVSRWRVNDPAGVDIVYDRLDYRRGDESFRS